MKTKDFIKMLQEADPTGETHIRMEGGIPIGAALIDGYYDGHYDYFDDEDNFVSSIEGSKVDIYCADVYSHVETNMGDGITWEEVKSKFKFKFGPYAYESSRTEKTDRILKEAKEWYNKIIEIDKNIS